MNMDYQKLKTQAQRLQATCVKHRRYLHQNAEVGFALDKTKAYIVETLTSLGYTPQTVGKAGVMAEIGKGGKTLLLRADSDGLPTREQTGLPFACKTGNMHACGHDMHTAMLLGVAELLQGYVNDLPVKVRLLFQPAEEILEGAKDCVKNGATEGLDYAMMLHVLTALPVPAGTVIIAEGESAPCADFFSIEVRGKACHGAAPQNGVDALMIGARILLALEELIAKEVPQTANAVLTIGRMQGGVADNAIADRAVLEGTLRGFGEDTRAYIKRRVEEIAKGIAKSFRGKAKFVVKSGCPTLVNDGGRVAFTKKALGQVLDENKVLLASQVQGAKEKSGGSEDFAYIAEQVPSVMCALCAGDSREGYTYPLHHPKARFDEDVLWQGVLAFATCALTKA